MSLEIDMLNLRSLWSGSEIVFNMWALCRSEQDAYISIITI